MSDISLAMTTALDALATAKGEALTYATTLGGFHSALTGFVLHQDLVAEPNYNEHDRADSQSMSATLKGPVTPLMVVGYEVKDTVTNLRWAVESVMIDVQQICRLMRRVEQKRGPNRGGAA